ncbi:uncharacterized protein TRIADDRAFT_54149 [Trichoplax adhaerens]|uniref:Uncharacterized protein n=1 Tax=Trichoplax adhaerens TaxID=10228 RepID=B3RR89_TRIAD|nr:predicted protein [Trichoplax adhaerens]EDV26835.1 predicted protein [Trichoplax adhaerens]|eukprot:XP_002110831.1 predicted protein [Trichoplax adhaerens]
MYSGKSVLFLKGLIYTLNKCLHYHFSVDYQEYCLALRDNIIDIYREIIQVLRLLFIEKGDILSSSIIDNASRYSDGKVMEAFNTTPIICIFEIVASQSPHLRIAGLGFLDVLMSQRKDHQEVKNTLKLLINVIRVNSRLLQGVIDHDVFSVLLRGMPRISKYRNILITRTIACAARSATASQIKQIAENHYVIQHLFETLMTNEEYEILGPTIQGIADLVKKSKQSPELFENNKAKVLPKLEMIRIEFSQHSTVLQPANQLVRLLNLKSKKK